MRSEFIDKWAETFGVEAQGFPYDRYFGPDSLDVIRSILGVFSKRYRDPELVPLTLGFPLPLTPMFGAPPQILRQPLRRRRQRNEIPAADNETPIRPCVG